MVIVYIECKIFVFCLECVECYKCRNCRVYFVRGFFFVGFDIGVGVGFYYYVFNCSGQNWIVMMVYYFVVNKNFKGFCYWIEFEIGLWEWFYIKFCFLQLGVQVCGVLCIKVYQLDIECFSVVQDIVMDVVIVDIVVGGGVYLFCFYLLVIDGVVFVSNVKQLCFGQIVLGKKFDFVFKWESVIYVGNIVG